MSLFKSKDAVVPHTNTSDNKPFVGAPVQLKDQKQSENESETEVIQPKSGFFGATPFVGPQTTIQRKNSPVASKTQTEVKKVPEEQTTNTSEKDSEGSTEEKQAASSSYWTHDWHIDRFGNEALFIWEVGGKRKYSNADKGYSYIREKATLLPADSGYDARFERFKHRPQVGEGSKAKLNWWMKRTPGWDNPNHADSGTADFTDLAEFKDTSENKKGTGFYYMAYVFDPLIYDKLEEQKANLGHRKYIGNQTNYRGYVKAEGGIILHETPTPSDEGYQAIRESENKTDFIIQFNKPVTVVAEGNQDNEGWVLVKTKSGERGWIERRYISKEPDPKLNELFDTYTVKEGDNLEDLIIKNYKDYPHSTGNDRRTIALAIYLYNKDKQGSGVYRDHDKYKKAESWKDTLDPWMQETRANYQSIELYTGGEIILPPKEYIAKMQQLGEVEKRPLFANVLIEGARVEQGFIVGVGIGVWDAILETGEDLYNMFKDIFSGEIINQIMDMFNMFMEKGLSGIWEMIKDFGISTWEEIKAAWNNPNPYDRGKYFGEITGAILFEVVLALLTYGIGAAVRNSARVQKVLKLFPSLDKKSVVPDDVDKYADDIKKMNGDRDADLDRSKNDRDKDNDRDKESDEDKAENAKALIAAKIYVEQQDALDPSPDVKVVVGAINKMPITKLKGGKKYKSNPNGMGDGHFEIYYNPKVKKDYTEGDKINDTGKPTNVEKARKLSSEVPKKWKEKFMCKQYASDLKTRLINSDIKGEFLEMKTGTGFIESDKFGNIATSGVHQAIKVDDMVFDNMRSNGISYSEWINDLGGKTFTTPPHAQITVIIF